MKIVLNGKFGNVVKVDDSKTHIAVKSDGSVQEAATTAKEALFDGTLILKPFIADQLKIGQRVLITIETVEKPTD